MIVIAVAITAMFYFNRKTPVDIPEELFGKWTTTDPKYSDRYFDLGRATVTFGLGENGFATYAIKSIRGMTEENHIVYTVTFIDHEGAEHSQSIYLYGNDKNSLIFKNQAGTVWRKQVD